MIARIRSLFWRCLAVHIANAEPRWRLACNDNRAPYRFKRRSF